MSPLRVINKPSPSSLASNDNAIFKTDGKTIYNVYNLAGQLIHVNQVNDNMTTDYVSLNGRSVARLRKVGSDVHKPTYIYADHLGSPVGQSIGSVSTNIIRERYTPFGIAMDNPSQLDDQGGFTGHIKDKATDLNYMQARYYDPVIGRFLSIDPVTFMDTGVTAQFNRYVYTANDPINMTDPNGECPWCVVGALIGGGIQIISEVNSGSFDDGLFSKDGLKAIGRIGVSSAVGAITGGAGASTAVSKTVVGQGIKVGAQNLAGNAARNAAVGGAASAVGQGTNNYIEMNVNGGGEISSIGDGVVDAGLQGAKFGAFGAALGDVAQGAGSVIKGGPFGAVGQNSPGVTAAAVTIGNVAGNSGNISGGNNNLPVPEFDNGGNRCGVSVASC